MKRRAFLLLPFAAPARPSATYDELRTKTLAIEKHWNRWTRKLFGCPLMGDTTAETCTQPSEVDYGALTAWAKAARQSGWLE